MANQVQKLSYVDNKLGVTLIGQQTTRVIYDSITATAGQQQFDFFTNFAGKTALQTNLLTNKLDASESMVIKSIYLVTNSGVPGGQLDGHSLLNITVGNQIVLKDFDPSPNSSGRGLAYARIHNGGAQNNISLEVRLLTDIVIPPQVNFRASLQMGTTLIPADANFTLVLKGYGKIFSAGNSF
jgi:hypothetical protein